MADIEEVRVGDLRYDGRLIVYIVKGNYLHHQRQEYKTNWPIPPDQTSYINYMKPLILIAELDLPHALVVVDTKSQWFYSIHPERYVPAIKDRFPLTGEEIVIFESTACLQCIAQRYDGDGAWDGRTAKEQYWHDLRYSQNTDNYCTRR